MRVLVIPEKASLKDRAYDHRPETWEEIAKDNDCDRVENFGSRWCVENRVDGLGVVEPYVEPVVEVPQPSLLEIVQQLKSRVDSHDTEIANLKSRRPSPDEVIIDNPLTRKPQ